MKLKCLARAPHKRQIGFGDGLNPLAQNSIGFLDEGVRKAQCDTAT